jgi:hypothetical protein
MSKIERAKNKINWTLNVLKNSLVNNLGCKEENVKLHTEYSDKTYSTILTIDFYDKEKKRMYKTFEIKGEYFPEITKFEYDGGDYVFAISSSEFIKKVQNTLNRIDASW